MCMCNAEEISVGRERNGHNCTYIHTLHDKERDRWIAHSTLSSLRTILPGDT